MKRLRKKRTELDWTKHQHRVEIFKSNEGNEIRVDHLQIDRNMGLYVKFTNSNTLTVSGDFGNWVFCRPFIPSKEGYVSDGYWKEKLEIHSIQKPTSDRYDFDKIISSIKEMILEIPDVFLEENHKEANEYLNRVLEIAETKEDQCYDAFLLSFDYPHFFDPEDIPNYKKEHHRLSIIFDAFEEICNRLDKNK